MNLKKIGKVLTSKSVRAGPSSYEKRIYRTAVSQRLRNTGVQDVIRIASFTQCTRPASRLPTTPDSASSAENHMQ